MSLRNRISATAFVLRFGGFAAVTVIALPTPLPWLGFVLGLAWLFGGSSLLRHKVLPLMFPTTRCPGCSRTIPLVARWKCGSHYTDHADRHILAFHCSQGHRLEGFDCPRCNSTILVQRGERERIRHGSGIRLKTVSKLPTETGLYIGRDSHRRGVHLSEERLAWHWAITGGTGRGKSTLLANVAKQMAQSGWGFTVLDPGGDLAKATIEQIPPERVDDVLYLNVADFTHPFPLNVLHAKSDMERAILVEELLGVFHKLHGTAWGPMLEHQLRMAFKTAMVTGGTLQDVLGLFTQSATRSRVIRKLRDPVLRAFWAEEFPSIPSIRRSAVTNKLTPIVFHPILSPIITATKCVLDADDAIRHRRIIIVNLATGSPGDDVTTLLGTFLVQKTLAAAFRQANLPSQGRVRHALIVDEFQRFMHRAASFDQILSEARKFKLSLIVANQYVEQLSPSVRAALFGNVGCLTAFRVGGRDARVLEPEFRGCLREELLELELGECLVRIGTDWTVIRTPPPPRRPEEDPTPGIMAKMRHRLSDTRTEPARTNAGVGDGDEDTSEDSEEELVR